MELKEKQLLGLFIALIVIGGLLNAAGIMEGALKEDRVYISADEVEYYNWRNTLVDYGKIKVNWNFTKLKDGLELYEVHKNGFTYWWTKEKIAKELFK